jgi:uncharacterized phage infection (PIP) family protein YhgE
VSFLAVDVSDLATNAGSIVGPFVVSIWVMHKYIVQPSLKRIEDKVSAMNETANRIESINTDVVNGIRDLKEHSAHVENTNNALGSAIAQLATATEKLANKIDETSKESTRMNDKQCLVMDDLKNGVITLHQYVEQWRLEQAKGNG